MKNQQQKPFAVITKEGKTIEFASSTELCRWAYLNKPEWRKDMELGIDYAQWSDDEFSTPEDIKRIYENTGRVIKTKTKEVVSGNS